MRLLDLAISGDHDEIYAELRTLPNGDLRSVLGGAYDLYRLANEELTRRQSFLEGIVQKVEEPS